MLVLLRGPGWICPAGGGSQSQRSPSSSGSSNESQESDTDNTPAPENDENIRGYSDNKNNKNDHTTSNEAEEESESSSGSSSSCSHNASRSPSPSRRPRLAHHRRASWECGSQTGGPASKLELANLVVKAAEVVVQLLLAGDFASDSGVHPSLARMVASRRLPMQVRARRPRCNYFVACFAWRSLSTASTLWGFIRAFKGQIEG